MIKLKGQGRTQSLQNLVFFDMFNDYERVKQEAENVGIQIYHIAEVIQAGNEYKQEIEFVEP